MKFLTVVLLFWGTSANAYSIIEFSEREEPGVQTDPPLEIDKSINRDNPLASIDPAYNWPEDSDDEGFDPS